MPGKYTDGYTKAAQRQKFVRNRDIKLKDSEIRKEERIQKGMCEGICDKCREKIQWKFKYDKYKPLKAPGTCQNCKRKTITKAYRTLCDPCAVQKNVCASCCGERTIESQAVEPTGPEQPEVIKGRATRKVRREEDDDDFDDDDFDFGDEDDDDDEGEDVLEKDEDGDEDGDDDNETGDVAAGAASAAAEASVETVFSSTNYAMTWDQRKFMNIAASKYSKARITGQEEPTESQVYDT